MAPSIQCRHSLKRNRQYDCQYVHDEVLYISSRLHQLSRAVIYGWTDGSFLGWHCVMLITYDYVLGKRVLTYWEIWGKRGQPWLQPDECLYRCYGKLCIFGKGKISSFQKCIVFHRYYEDIHMAVPRISPIFPVRKLVPFSQIQNHMSILLSMVCEAVKQGTQLISSRLTLWNTHHILYPYCFLWCYMLYMKFMSWVVLEAWFRKNEAKVWRGGKKKSKSEVILGLHCQQMSSKE